MRYPEFWIRKCRGLEPVQRSVMTRMVAFASNRGGEGWVCNPFKGTIADDLEMSLRHVERAIKSTIEKQFISSEKNFRGSKKWANTYTININRLHPPCEKSKNILEAIKAKARNLMNEDEFNEWWRDMKHGWYDEKRHIFWLWAESKKHKEKLEKHLQAIDDFLLKQFGLITRKLPKNAKRATPQIPLMHIKLVDLFLKKTD